MKTKQDYPYQHIYERDNFTCRYCGVNGSKDFNSWWNAALTIDHITPVIHGGTDDPSNLVVSCHSCNLYKGSENCRSFDDAKVVVDRKRKEGEVWFLKHAKTC